MVIKLLHTAAIKTYEKAIYRRYIELWSNVVYEEAINPASCN